MSDIFKKINCRYQKSNKPKKSDRRVKYKLLALRSHKRLTTPEVQASINSRTENDWTKNDREKAEIFVK